MGKSTLSMAIFNSFLLTFTRGYHVFTVSSWERGHYSMPRTPKHSTGAAGQNLSVRMPTDAFGGRCIFLQRNPSILSKKGNLTTINGDLMVI